MNMSFTGRIRVMLKIVGLPNSFWVKAGKITCYVVNWSSSIAIKLKMLGEMWPEKPIDYSHLYIFRCHVCVMYNVQERKNLDSKSKRWNCLEYVDRVKRYHLWDPTTHKIVISKDVIFVKNQLQKRDKDDSCKKKSQILYWYM